MPFNGLKPFCKQSNFHCFLLQLNLSGLITLTFIALASIKLDYNELQAHSYLKSNRLLLKNIFPVSFAQFLFFSTDTFIPHLRQSSGQDLKEMVPRLKDDVLQKAAVVIT